MNISSNIDAIKSELTKKIVLVAVSKTKPIEDILKAYRAGHRIFGENKVQEMALKYAKMPHDIQWHMIGHLQRNKVKYIASFVHLIHGVDSFKLLKEIDKQAKKNGRVINCLFQVKIAQEQSKYGMTKEEIISIINSDEFSGLKNINVVGLMGMATFTNNENQIKQEFSLLKITFDNLSSENQSNFNLQILSMGMSGDYKIAIACGSTMIRIGSTIFGSRT